MSLLTPHQRHGKPIYQGPLLSNKQSNYQVTKQNSWIIHHLILGQSDQQNKESIGCMKQKVYGSIMQFTIQAL